MISGGHMDLAQFLVQTREWPEVLDQARQVQQLVSRTTPEATLLELQARHAAAGGRHRSGGGAREGLAGHRDAAGAAGQDRDTESLDLKLLQAQVALIAASFPRRRRC